MWIKLDDRKSGSTPVMRAWRARRSPLGLSYLAELHAGAHETDGYIDEAHVEEWVPNAAERGRFVGVLLETGLWVQADGGWSIAGFTETNPSAAELILRRAADAKRKAIERSPSLRRSIRVRDHGCCRYCGTPVAAEGSRNGDGASGSFAVVDPAGDVCAENVVVCCRSCKRLKGVLTDQQAGLSILPAPPVQTTLTANVQVDSARTSSTPPRVCARESGPPDPSRPVPTRPDPKAVVQS